MAEFEPNRCYACKKLFCCIDCCTNHIRNKHPGRESECPLCRSEFLIVRNFDNPHFMCHVVINHLPLHCRTCGNLFECSDDLKSLGTCSRRPSKRTDNVSEEQSKFPHGPSPLTQTPLNPVNQVKGYSIEGDYNAKFQSLISPPEFTRNTSTPMHIGLSRKTTSIVFKPPGSPNFSLKTPTSIPQGVNKTEEPNEGSKSVYSHTGTPHIQNKQSSRDSNLQELLEQSDSIYLSFSPSIRSNASVKSSLKSILMSRSSVENLETQRDKMLELEGTTADMDLTDPQGSTPLSPDLFNQEVKAPPDEVVKLTGGRDSGKRVRFSDEFEVKEEPEISSSRSSVSGTEEFFEARQSLSEFTVTSPKMPPEGSKDPDQEDVTPISTFQPLIDFSSGKHEENKSPGNKENILNTNIENGFPTSTKQNEGNKLTDKTVSDSSRVVMMVLVEKTGAGGNVDLAPLINSGLKTLESVTTSMKSGQQGPSLLEETSGVHKKLVMSVDTYQSVSIEHHRKPPSEESDHRIRTEKTESGGLFSAVANAVRTAFKNISEVVSARPVAGEQQTHGSIPMIKIDPPAQTPPPRPLKRSREAMISMDSEATEIDDDETSNDIRSPEQKRLRGWYRQIRGREPIARMRGDTILQNRGISNETQCFRQGSLSARDTVLPLPSRAHQSTQTDH
ncbi:uncharacterized protein LOC135164776 isoform X2 [Diachasmimorpha longicaudata]|uniref:uncharacterized protein LOC135164776 isoform X2 n=1 Tax=Diachasmimorpha longicaudata TaxID=58733 RepID=UPI0030B8B1C0